METSDEDSDAEHRTTRSHFCGLTFNPKMEGFPSTVNILKPQIDKIFSEVQKNLPTIDFDSSDVSRFYIIVENYLNFSLIEIIFVYCFI